MNPAADEVSPILKSRLDVAEGEEYEEQCGDPQLKEYEEQCGDAQLNIKPGMFFKILESRIQRRF